MKKLWSIWVIFFGIILWFLPAVMGPHWVENLFMKMPSIYFIFGLIMFFLFSGRIITLIGIIIFAFQIGKVISDKYYGKK